MCVRACDANVCVRELCLFPLPDQTLTKYRELNQHSVSTLWARLCVYFSVNVFANHLEGSLSSLWRSFAVVEQVKIDVFLMWIHLETFDRLFLFLSVDVLLWHSPHSKLQGHENENMSHNFSSVHYGLFPKRFQPSCLHPSMIFFLFNICSKVQKWEHCACLSSVAAST